MALSLDLNWIAIVVSGVLTFILGGVWFSPLLFAKPWMKAIGLTKSDIEETQISMAKAFTTSFVAGLVMSVVTALLLTNFQVNTFAAGALFGLLVFLAYNLSSYIKILFYEDRPLALIMIVGGYDLISFVMAGGLLATWK